MQNDFYNPCTAYCALSASDNSRVGVATLLHVTNWFCITNQYNHYKNHYAHLLNTKIWSKIAEVIFWTLLKYGLNQSYAHYVWNEPSKDKNEAKRPPKGVKTGHFEEKCMFFEKKLGKDLVEWKNRRTFATANEKEQRFTLKTRMPWAISAAGSEHLPYKQRVGGSNPSTPTIKLYVT